MQSFFEQRTPRLDTSSPSVRHLQDLIRSRSLVHIEMSGGQTLTGQIKWQDHQFIALQPDPTLPLVLVNRERVALLRSLG
jgi:host factor-I protein